MASTHKAEQPFFQKGMRMPIDVAISAVSTSYRREYKLAWHRRVDMMGELEMKRRDHKSRNSGITASCPAEVAAAARPCTQYDQCLL